MVGGMQNMRGAVVVLGALCIGVDGKHTKAQMLPGERFLFVDQFVFDTTPRGDAQWKVRTVPPVVRYWAETKEGKPLAPDSYGVVMYDDQPYSWPAVHYKFTDEDVWSRDPAAVCRNASRGCGGNCWDCPMKLCGNPDPLGSQCRVPDDTVANRNECRYEDSVGYTPNSTTGECPMYLLVVNCGLNAASGITVHVKWENPGGWWRREFSMDRQGLLEMYTLYVILGAALYAAYAFKLYRNQQEQGEGAYTHIVLKWWFATASIQLVSFVFFWGHYISFAGDGIGHPWVMWTAVGLDTLAALLFMVLLLVFSTGFTVVGVTLGQRLLDPLRQTRRVIVGLFFVLLVLSVIMYCLTAREMTQVPESVPNDNPYQTWAGVMLACFRVPVALFYLHNLQNSCRQAPEMVSFYRRWGLVFLGYILFLPIAMMLANVVSPWVKFRAVQCTVDTVTLTAFALMGALLWPGHRAQRSLARTYSVAETGPCHMPIGDHGSAMPDYGRDRGSTLGPSQLDDAGSLVEDETEMQSIPLQD
eukprot:Hpha_TRINITY_DN2883_c0_g1::TRINITY_DN2883_c0_g1_i1::g.171450::m.171450